MEDSAYLVWAHVKKNHPFLTSFIFKDHHHSSKNLCSDLEPNTLAADYQQRPKYICPTYTNV